MFKELFILECSLALTKENHFLHLSFPGSSRLFSWLCVSHKVLLKHDMSICVFPSLLQQLHSRPHIYIIWWPAHQSVPSCGTRWSPKASPGWRYAHYVYGNAGGAMLAPDSFWTYQGRMWMTSGKDFYKTLSRLPKQSVVGENCVNTGYQETVIFLLPSLWSFFGVGQSAAWAGNSVNYTLWIM